MPVVTFNDLRKSGAPLNSKEALKRYRGAMSHIPFKGTKSLEIVLKLAENKKWADLLQEISKNPNGNKNAIARKYIAIRGVRKELVDKLLEVVGKDTPKACKDALKELENDDNLIAIGMDLHAWNSSIADSDFPVLEALLDTVLYVEVAADVLEELKVVDDFKESKK